MTTETYGPFTLESRPDGVVILWIDVPGERVNTLKAADIDAFDQVLDVLENAKDIKILVVASAKDDSYSAGANIDMLQGIATAAEGQRLSATAQRVYGRLAAVPAIKVAAIHGACVGGGAEMVLALDARVASDDPKTKIGLPEVQLGLLPGGGGTQRLPRLIGVQAALDLMLTGKQIDARRARRLNLVDEVVPRAILIDAAVALGRERLQQTQSPEPESLAGRLKHFFAGGELQELALAGNPVGRKVLFDQARKQTLARTRGNYPAPERILEVVRIGLEDGEAAGYRAEAEAFGELLTTPQSRQLIRLFFAANALKKDSGVDAEPRPVRKVGILGGGLMGAGIGYVTLHKAGVAVRLKDKDDAGVGHGLGYIHKRLDEQVQRRRLSRVQRDRALARLTATTDYRGFADADVVIEAVFEDLELKRRMIRDVEAAGREDVIFASNTSALPIAAIAEASAHPETVAGMHYFSPVEKMPLLEVVKAEKTAPWVVATCVALGRKQGKTVIVVNDGAGFYTSRILVPYLNEAAWLLAEGVAVEDIDSALKDFGFPVGPVALLDEVGIDVGAKVVETVHGAFGDRMAPPPVVDRLLADDRRGRKNRRGFYVYDGGKGSEKTVDAGVYQA
ncbi:MAG: 3-hydroxyacyl-CoA dehydrogenase NAD-binding domain-containing protein, partial [Pseudomonadota bacterium]|nr:3-hydroxyacyl-CoA dehydrogenase NAD-binding domain-containing protein [Pseudomonadota bacterium]